MGTLSNYREYLERHVGSYIVDIRHAPSRLGETVYFANGARMYVDEQLKYELTRRSNYRSSYQLPQDYMMNQLYAQQVWQVAPMMSAPLTDYQPGSVIPYTSSQKVEPQEDQKHIKNLRKCHWARRK